MQSPSSKVLSPGQKQVVEFDLPAHFYFIYYWDDPLEFSHPLFVVTPVLYLFTALTRMSYWLSAFKWLAGFGTFRRQLIDYILMYIKLRSSCWNIFMLIRRIDCVFYILCIFRFMMIVINFAWHPGQENWWRYNWSEEEALIPIENQTYDEIHNCLIESFEGAK